PIPHQEMPAFSSSGVRQVLVELLQWNRGVRVIENRSPAPERRLQGSKNRQIDREWRPDEHRRPVGLTPVPARARRNACKTLAESSGRLSLWVAQESVRSAKEGPAFSKGKLKCLYQAVRRLVIRGGA